MVSTLAKHVTGRHFRMPAAVFFVTFDSVWNGKGGVGGGSESQITGKLFVQL